ncbi:MAG: ABC transporter permease [Deltaproteobacteria bacterium]|nr:ABC transporter permease [Deltaproteobacteria bacterium]
MDLVKVFGESIEEEMDFFTPVLPPFFAFFFVFILSGLTFLRERVDGTAERVLASPLHRGELVLGYVLGFLPAALLQATVVILFARFALGGPWGGWPVVLTVLLLTLVAECVGVFVSAFARSEFQVFQFIPVIILPSTPPVWDHLASQNDAPRSQDRRLRLPAHVRGRSHPRCRHPWARVWRRLA